MVGEMDKSMECSEQGLGSRRPSLRREEEGGVRVPGPVTKGGMRSGTRTPSGR